MEKNYVRSLRKEKPLKSKVWFFHEDVGGQADVGGFRASPLHRYWRLDQMMFSWEKQNTPRRPPRMDVSMITPESATS